ncbi:MAG: phospholipase A [Desulfosarcinaceae bacterium]
MNLIRRACSLPLPVFPSPGTAAPRLVLTAAMMCCLVGWMLFPGVQRCRAEENAPASDSAAGPSMDTFFNLYQPYLANISAYEPMYFLVGADPGQSKFQISLKYRPFGDRNALAERHPWMRGIHFGYTQTSFWDLASASAPFEDTSYKPELFYISDNLSYRPDWMKGFIIQTGARHESNGRAGDESRSTNTVYAQPIFIYYNPVTRLGLGVGPRAWFYAKNDNETNADLDDYRGYFDLNLKVGKADGFVFGARVGWAREGFSVYTDLTYPLNRLIPDSAGIYLQAQYVDALAESLLDYRERTQAFRFGLAIVR